MRRPKEDSSPLRQAGFHIDVPVVAFEKADAPEGQKKRIAGIISTDGLDAQDERIIQEGLDFEKYLSCGHLNDNHSNQSVCDIVGYPQSVKMYKRGDTLPNGQPAASNCTWTEGFLIGKKGADIWHIAKDMQGTPRSLGFSVEGSITKRDAKDPKTILAATVQNVAVTHCPVNRDTKLELLARSLTPATALSHAAPSRDTTKAFTVGSVPTQSAAHPLPQPAPNTVRQGEGVGQLLTAAFARNKKRLRKRAGKVDLRPGSAARQAQARPSVAKGASSAPVAKGPNLLKKADALDWIRKAVPGVSDPTAEAFLCHAQRLLAQGLI